MPRFFAEIEDGKARISGRDISHIAGALRKRRGDELDIRHGSKGFRARITDINPNEIALDIIEEQQLADRGVMRLHLAVSLIDLKEMDDMVRLVSELGVACIHPIIAEHSNVRAVTQARIDRWSEIIKEALKQTQAGSIPEITQPIGIAAFIKMAQINWTQRYYAQMDSPLSIADISVDEACVIIGPEGGFTSHEVEEMNSHGFKPVGMGNTVLRTFAAAVVAASILCMKGTI
jgi:16S rRNA (uracil1498-N3)-methyltransferase